MSREAQQEKSVIKKTGWPTLGCGVGLRSLHYPLITSEWPELDWFEAITENYMDSGGRPFHILKQVREHYPVALHGVSLSIGSTDPLHPIYLKHLKNLVERIEPAIVSDHLCWTGVEGKNLHDLLPLPFTEEAIGHIVRRVEQVQDLLGRRILLENVSSYVTYQHSVIPEWEFLREVALRSGCGILLDINNIYVNAFNHHFDPREYLRNIPPQLVGQFHLAGHTDMGDFLFDTHSKPVIDPVWELYREALGRFGQVATLIEWDEDIPEFGRLAREAAHARAIYLSSSEAKRSFPGLPGESKMDSRFSAEGRIRPVSGGRGNGSFCHPSLAELQHEFRLAVNAGDSSQAKNLPLNPQAGVPGAERLSVYANGYYARLHESLTEVYPAVQQVLGEKVFASLAHQYAEQFPSQEYNLNLTGRHFPEFLRGSEISAEMPFLADLAELEWRVSAVFHAYDGMPFDASVLSRLTPEEWGKARIVFQPSVSILHSPWPVFDIWKARHEPVENIKVDLVDRPQHVLIFRRELKVQCIPIPPPQYRLLEGLLAGKTLGEICEALIQDFDGASAEVSGWFAGWVRLGLVADCKIQSRHCERTQ